MAWTDRSALEQEALRYCAPKGIPLSVFFGRVVYPGDPQWTDDDALAALDWQADQDSRCPECNQPIDEAMKKSNSYAYRAESVRCHGCHAIAAEASRLAGNQVSTHAGTRYRVHLVEAG